MQMDLLTIKPEPLNDYELDLHKRAVKIGSEFNEAEKSVLTILDEVEKSKFYHKLGYRYITTYARDEMKLSEATAGFHVSVLHKSRAVPDLRTAIDQGEISVSTAAQITSVINPQNATEWIEKANTMPKHKLEEEVAKVSPRTRKKPKLKWVDNETSELTIHFSKAEREKFERAKVVEEKRRGQTVSHSELINEAIKLYLEKKDPIEKAERAQPQPTTKHYPTYRNGKRTPVPTPLAHAANLRDRDKCRIVGPDGKECGSSHFTQMHHLIAVEDGGQHTLENLVTICGHHHRMLHGPFPGKAEHRPDQRI